MMTFLQLNGISVDCTDGELIRLGLGLASGEVSQEELFKWIVTQTDK